MKTLLVTGFGPFPGIRVNPSATLAKRLAGDRQLRAAGISVQLALIPTTYAAADRLIPTLAAARPDAVLMLGVAGRRKGLSVELRARNRLATLLPDASGAKPQRMVLAPGGPDAKRARAPVARLVVAARGSGIAARPSRDAGAYLCNYSYWTMLSALPQNSPCVFVHVPKLAGRRMVAAQRALKAMARLLIR